MRVRLLAKCHEGNKGDCVDVDKARAQRLIGCGRAACMPLAKGGKVDFNVAFHDFPRHTQHAEEKERVLPEPEKAPPEYEQEPEAPQPDMAEEPPAKKPVRAPVKKGS